MRKLQIFLACMLLSSFCNVKAAYFPETFSVESTMPSNVGLHVKLSPNPSQCTSNWWGTQFVIKTTTDNYNGLTAALLSAFMSGKKIRAVHYQVDGDGSCSYGNWFSISAFQILK